MTDEVKNMPELRFPEFKEVWEDKILDEVSTFSKGKGISKNDLSKDGTPCILYGELYTTYDFIINKIKSKTLLDDKNLVKGKKNQVLIPSSGETPLDIATAAVINTTEDVLLGGDINVLTPAQNYDGKFISLSINGKNKRNLSKYAQGKSVVHLYNKDIKKLKIKFPVKISEQERIGNFFSKLDQQIELEEQKLSLLKEEEKGYIQQIFSQELRFEDEDYSEWKKIKLIKVLTERKKYKSKDSGVPHATLSTQGIYLKNERYNRDFLVKDKEKKYKISKKDDICYNPANLKFGVITRNNLGTVIFSPIYVTFEVDSNHIPNFIEKMLTRWDFINKVRKFEEGTVYERMAVKPEDFLSYETYVPCLSEQEKIGNFFSELEERIKKQCQKIDMLKLRKKAFLQKMFV